MRTHTWVVRKRVVRAYAHVGCEEEGGACVRTRGCPSPVKHDVQSHARTRHNHIPIHTPPPAAFLSSPLPLRPPRVCVCVCVCLSVRLLTVCPRVNVCVSSPSALFPLSITPSPAHTRYAVAVGVDGTVPVNRQRTRVHVGARIVAVLPAPVRPAQRLRA